MEKTIFTPLQTQIFEEFAKDEILPKHFYFTGGTALSVFYYQHRWSEDLDFFSDEKFDEREVLPFIDRLRIMLQAEVAPTKFGIAHTFKFLKNGELIMKIDFVYDYFKRIRPQEGENYLGVGIDSLRDIGANKISTIGQRTQVKDYVDLFFLMKNNYSIWDLIYALEAKYRITSDAVLIASDLMRVQEFEELPNMIKPLKLDELKKFIVETAKKIAGGVVIP